MVSTFTTNKNLELPANGDYVDTWNIPVNDDMSVIDQAFGGITSLNATSGSAILNVSQYRSLIISVSQAMSGDVVYTIPSGIGGQWLVKNSTTDATGGPWTVTFASAGGGSTVAIPRNSSVLIYSTGSSINTISDNIPSGTKMLFAQTSAPTGWVKVTTYNDYALRVVSGAAGTGGSVSFTTAFASQSVSGTVGSTTLTVDQIPAHTHPYTIPQSGGGTPVVTGFYTTNYNSFDYSGTTSSTGGGQSHTHTFTGTAINLAVNYVDVIIATKD